MGRAFKLLATNKAIEEIAEVVSWHISDLRNQILGSEDIVEAVYVVDGAHATPSPQLSDLLDQYDNEHPGYRQIKDRIVLDSVKRAVNIYCGFFRLDSIHFVDSDSAIPKIDI